MWQRSCSSPPPWRCCRPPAPTDANLPTQTVDTLNKIWGVHPGYRATHAKGVVVEGEFKPTPDGKAISKAILFQDKPSPVTVRFSDSGGLPTLPDGAAPANPHGMAMKFHLSDGADMDIVANSLQYFPVPNGEDFLKLLQAVASSPPTAPKPTNLDQFFEAHPVAKAALDTAETPTSFAREVFYGIDAFIFVDAAGKRQPFRFIIIPGAGTEHMSHEDAAKQKPNFLMDEIVQRVGKGPVTFGLLAQLAEAGDPINDPTKPWPSDRKLVNLGTITLDKNVPDSDAAQKKLLFLPSNLTDGIEQSADPLINARSQAYGVSFGRRSQQ